jgi:hypothetical protein
MSKDVRGTRERIYYLTPRTGDDEIRDAVQP